MTSGRSDKEHRNIGKRKTKYACIVEAGESTRKRMKGFPHKNRNRWHERD